MGDLVIEVQGLGKRYRLGHRVPHATLRDSLTNLWQFKNDPEQHIWAVKDISFEVGRGEVVGLIGRNGTGKSTLLKLLSRIIEPTEGRARVCGRVRSLLEVGTGFHQELTGRENIYLNGANLGMTRAEINRKFDEIVAFSEIEKFLDTPVKYYSSGMYVRLAFSVAAHLEPDILFIDEVLAVGDTAFQKKCLGKIGDMVHQERTVLFVSHNMTAVMNLCQSAILLEAGRMVMRGPVRDVIDRYLAQTPSAAGNLDGHPRDGSGKIRFCDFNVTDNRGNSWLYPDQPAHFRMTLKSDKPGLLSSRVTVAFALSTLLGERLIEFHTRYDKKYQEQGFEFEASTILTCTTQRIPLKPGVYALSLYVDCDGELCDRLFDAVQVVIKETDFYGTGLLPTSHTQGWMLLEQHWRREG